MARNQLRPLFDRVVIKELEPDRMRQSGLVVPAGSHEPPPQHGIVLAVGQGVDWWEAAGVQMPVRPGDHVVFPASAGAWVEVDEERLLVCRVTELLGVLERVEQPLRDARLGDALRRGLTAGSAGEGFAGAPGEGQRLVENRVFRTRQMSATGSARDQICTPSTSPTKNRSQCAAVVADDAAAVGRVVGDGRAGRACPSRPRRRR